MQLTYTVLSFSELKLSQEELQNLIDPAAPLQLINGGEDSAYVVYQFDEIIAADIEEEGKR
ncbi:hypothetical protein CW734_09435 [Planococcus sp. MB-3u-03]|nr:hypothetical protein CW734_09435 [Planococcus sp. MB-3u-03]